MKGITFAACTTFVLSLLLLLTTQIKAQPEEGENRQAKKAKERYVIVRADLYEVDEAFYKKVAKAKWLSKEELDEMEDRFLNQPKDQQSKPKLLFAFLEKQKPLLAGKAIIIDPGQEALVLDFSKTINCLPSPEQLRQGQKGPQAIRQGVSLRVHVQISRDTRFVRTKFMEKSLELEGTEKVTRVLDEERSEVIGEIAFLKEASLTRVRDIPDSADFLLPLQYRPRATIDKDRWLVAKIVPRIYIEVEERQIRGGPLMFAPNEGGSRSRAGWQALGYAGGHAKS